MVKKTSKSDLTLFQKRTILDNYFKSKFNSSDIKSVYLNKLYYQFKQPSYPTQKEFSRFQLFKLYSYSSYNYDLGVLLKKITLPFLKNQKLDFDKKDSLVLDYARQITNLYLEDFNSSKSKLKLTKTDSFKDFKESLDLVTSTYRIVSAYNNLKKISNLLDDSQEKIIPSFHKDLLPLVSELNPFAEDPIALFDDLVTRMMRHNFKVQKEFLPLVSNYFSERIVIYKNLVDTLINNSSSTLLPENIKECARLHPDYLQRSLIVQNELFSRSEHFYFKTSSNSVSNSYFNKLNIFENEAKRIISLREKEELLKLDSENNG